MMNNFFNNVTSNSISWHRLLRRTIVRPVFMASFNQSSLYGVFIPSLEGRLSRLIKNLQKGWVWKTFQNKIDNLA